MAQASAPSTSILIDPSTQYQTFEGWGTSLSWWANIVGGWSTANRQAVTSLLFSQTNGLGMNIARYNIGAGTNPNQPSG